MSFKTGPAVDEMSQAGELPQLDASSLVDGERLKAEVKDMYRRVARGEEAALHFAVGRAVAEGLGYPRELLDAIPAQALASFAGVGYHLDLAAVQPGEAESISLVAVKTRAQPVCASRHTSARIWVVGADVAQAARQEGLTNSTTE
ncbi:MAG TPA: hypothetical protein VFY32_00350, partial [Solirubrobacteraceae bacterium]|nr:hypothetical protein [Solirubrobacteraceae bacterium]